MGVIYDKFNNLSKVKKIILVLVVAVVVISVGVIISQYTSPVVSEPTNDVVHGYFRKSGCGLFSGPGFDKYGGNDMKASSLEECRRIGKEVGATVAGFRDENHTQEKYKNTCYFYKCIPSDFDRNDPMYADDLVHSMSCVNDATTFENCGSQMLTESGDTESGDTE